MASPTSLNQLKMNVDASLNGSGCVGIGVIIRDHHGQVIVALASKGYGNLQASSTELCAIRAGLEFALESGIPIEIIEGDSAGVTTNLKKNDRNFVEEGQLVEDCCQLLRQWPNISLVLILKECNHPVDRLSRFRLCTQDPQI